MKLNMAATKLKSVEKNSKTITFSQIIMAMTLYYCTISNWGSVPKNLPSIGYSLYSSSDDGAMFSHCASNVSSLQACGINCGLNGG